MQLFVRVTKAKLYLLRPRLYAQHIECGLAHRNSNCKDDENEENNIAAIIIVSDGT